MSHFESDIEPTSFIPSTMSIPSLYFLTTAPNLTNKHPIPNTSEKSLQNWFFPFQIQQKTNPHKTPQCIYTQYSQATIGFV